MAERRTITLVGDFQDNITPSLKKINDLLKQIGGTEKGKRGGKRKRKGDNAFFNAKEVLDGIDEVNAALKGLDKTFKNLGKRDIDLGKKAAEAANAEIDALQKKLKDLAKPTEVGVDSSSLRAAQEEATALSKMLSQKGELDLDSSSIRAAQEASILMSILQGASAIKMGETFAQGISQGTASATQTMGRGIGFVQNQLRAAAQDQLEDIQARGSLFGGLNKAEMFGKTPTGKSPRELARITDANYEATKRISKELEKAMGDQITKSTNPTDVITLFHRQLTDNILPTVLKAQGVTNFDKAKGADGRIDPDILQGILQDSGTASELATLYDQMAAVSPQKHYAPISARAYAEYLSTGKVNRRLGVFMQNPVLADALEEKGIAAGGDPAKLLQALKEGLEIAMPKAALLEAQTTFTGSMQALSDTLMNASVGILSFGADMGGQGDITLEMARKSGALGEAQRLAEKKYEFALKRDKESVKELKALMAAETVTNKRESYRKKIALLEKKIAETEKNKAADLQDLRDKAESYYRNQDSPFEVLMAATGGVISELTNFLGTLGNVWMPLVNRIFAKVSAPMAKLASFIQNVTEGIEDLPDDASFETIALAWSEGLGKIVGKLAETLANILTGSEKDLKDGGDFIDKIIASFMKGFNSINGKKNVEILLDALTKLINKVFFNEGLWYKGLSKFSMTLLKVFAILAAPAAISAMLGGFITIIGYTLGGALVAATKSALVGLTAKKAVGAGLGKAAGAGFFMSPGMSSASSGISGAIASKMAPYSYAGRMISAYLPRIFSAVSKGTALLTVFDIFIRKFTGQSWGQSIGGGLSAGLGSILGAIIVGAIAPPLAPLGAIAGAIAGGALFDRIWNSLSPAAEAQRKAAEAQNRLSTILEKNEANKPRPEKWMYLMDELGGAAGVRDLLSKNKDLVPQNVQRQMNPVLDKYEQLGILEAQKKAKEASLRQVESTQAGAAGAKRVADLQNQIAELSGKIKTKQDEVAKAYASAGSQTQTALGVLAGVIDSGSTEVDLSLKRLAQRIEGSSPKPKPKDGPIASPLGLGGELIRKPADPSKAGKPVARKPKAKGAYDGNYPKNSPLAMAIQSEMKNKPAGSDLVIANSSETIIPSAGGLNTDGLFQLISQGFSVLTAASDGAKDAAVLAGKAGMQKTEDLGNQMVENLTTLDKATKDTIAAAKENTISKISATGQAVLSAISSSSQQILSAISSINSMAGMLGGGAGGAGMGAAGVRVAAALGFFMKANGQSAWRQDSHGGRPTSGHAPGSYHYQGRAIDIPGGPAQHPRILALIAKFNAMHGVRPVELLHAGNRADHQDHVHVAYGYGAGNPAFFKSASEADSWEKAVAKGNPIVSSVRARADEVGTNQTNNINITIHQQPGQDAEELAAVVADKLSMALEAQIARTMI